MLGGNPGGCVIDSIRFVTSGEKEPPNMVGAKALGAVSGGGDMLGGMLCGGDMFGAAPPGGVMAGGMLPASMEDCGGSGGNGSGTGGGTSDGGPGASAASFPPSCLDSPP